MKQIIKNWKSLIMLCAISILNSCAGLNSSVPLTEITDDNGIKISLPTSTINQIKSCTWNGPVVNGKAQGNGRIRGLFSDGAYLFSAKANEGSLTDLVELEGEIFADQIIVKFNNPKPGHTKLYDSKNNNILGEGTETHFKEYPKNIALYDRRTGIYTKLKKQQQLLAQAHRTRQQQQVAKNSNNPSGALSLLGMIGGGLMSANGNEYGGMVTGLSETVVANSNDSEVRAIGGVMQATNSALGGSTTSVPSGGKKPNLLTGNLKKYSSSDIQYSSIADAAKVYYASYQETGDDRAYQAHKQAVESLKRFKHHSR